MVFDHLNPAMPIQPFYGEVFDLIHGEIELAGLGTTIPADYKNRAGPDVVIAHPPFALSFCNGLTLIHEIR